MKHGRMLICIGARSGPKSKRPAPPLYLDPVQSLTSPSWLSAAVILLSDEREEAANAEGTNTGLFPGG